MKSVNMLVGSGIERVEDYRFTLGANGSGGAVGVVIANASAAALRALKVEPRDLPRSPLWRLLAEPSRAAKRATLSLKAP